MTVRPSLACRNRPAEFAACGRPVAARASSRTRVYRAMKARRVMSATTRQRHARARLRRRKAVTSENSSSVRVKRQEICGVPFHRSILSWILSNACKQCDVLALTVRVLLAVDQTVQHPQSVRRRSTPQRFDEHRLLAVLVKALDVVHEGSRNTEIPTGVRFHPLKNRPNGIDTKSSRRPTLG